MDTIDTNQVIANDNHAGASRAPRGRLPRISRRVLGGLAVLLAGGALTLSVAQAHGLGPGGGGGFLAFRMHKILEKVNATDGQKAQIKAIWEGLRPQLRTTHDEHRKLRQQITQAMTAPTIDPAGIEKLRQQSIQLMDRASATMTKGFIETARILTPEQRKQAAAELEKERQNRRARFQGGQGGGDELEGPGPF
jgi:Spy/CpxP family protein refolding chaperone